MSDKSLKQVAFNAERARMVRETSLSLSQLVRVAFKSGGLTVKQVARHAGLEDDYLEHVLANNEPMDFEEAVLILCALNRRLAFIVLQEVDEVG